MSGLRFVSRKVKTRQTEKIKTETGLILQYLVCQLSRASISQCVCVCVRARQRSERPGRCTDSSLHAGTVFLSSISMQDRKKTALTLVFHWLPTVARPWHPVVFIGRYEE